jgi:hypothetical protein
MAASGTGSLSAEAQPEKGGRDRCARCRLQGLVFPDGGRRCFVHASAQDVDLVERLDAMAPAIGLTKPRGFFSDWDDRASWPYGPNIDVLARARLVDWASGSGLKRAQRRAPDCLEWLVGRRCGGRKCHRWSSLSPWLDHVTGWERDDQPAVLVAQPYKLSPEDHAELRDISETPGLRVELRAEGSWYGHGTWFVGVWNTER